MKYYYRTLARVLILMMILVMIPVYAFGETVTLKTKSEMSFKVGTDYDLTVAIGEFYTLTEKNDYELVSLESSDEDIAIVSYDSAWQRGISIRGIHEGEAIITVTSKRGDTSDIYLTVTKEKTRKLDAEYIIEYDIGNDYKLTVIAGEEYVLKEGYNVNLDSLKSSDKNVAKISKDDSLDNWARIKAKFPGKTTLTLIDSDGVTSKIKLNVKMGKAEVLSDSWIYKNSKSAKFAAYNVQKGDVVKLKIGKKTYTKKFKKTSLKTNIKFKIKKPGFYGKKYKITLTRNGKVIYKDSDYVFLSDTVYVGYSKKKVKWLKYWNNPDRKNKSAYTEQWCYDWDNDGITDAYLYFRNGKVTDWQTFE